MVKKFLEENIEHESKSDMPESKKVVAEYLANMRNFENDRIVLVKDQNKFLKKVTAVSLGIAVLGVGALIGLTPLKTVEPYLLRVDNVTGAADVVRPLENVTGTTTEKMDKYWLSRAIQERESYTWVTVQSSYDAFKLFSSPAVFSQYETYIFGKESPVTKFEDSKSIKVDFRGTTFIKTGDQVVAQVKLSKTVTEKDGKPSPIYPVTYWQATATFDYSKVIKRSSEEQVNPLGFEITSYRIDPIAG